MKEYDYKRITVLFSEKNIDMYNFVETWSKDRMCSMSEIIKDLIFQEMDRNGLIERTKLNETQIRNLTDEINKEYY